MQKKTKGKLKKYSQKATLDRILIACASATTPEKGAC
jgi:hypothetical protein